MGWINLAQDRDKRWVVVTTVENFGLRKIRVLVFITDLFLFIYFYFYCCYYIIIVIIILIVVIIIIFFYYLFLLATSRCVKVQY